MHVAMLKATALLAGVGAVTPVGSQSAGSLVVHAVRAYRPPQGRTEVNAFMQIPYMLLQPTTDGPDDALSYKITVKVADSTGLTLLSNSWQNHAPATARQPDASWPVGTATALRSSTQEIAADPADPGGMTQTKGFAAYDWANSGWLTVVTTAVTAEPLRLAA